MKELYREPQMEGEHGKSSQLKGEQLQEILSALKAEESSRLKVCDHDEMGFSHQSTTALTGLTYNLSTPAH